MAEEVDYDELFQFHLDTWRQLIAEFNESSKFLKENTVPASENPGCFDSYLAKNCSLDELDQMFLVTKNQMNANPCCKFHTGDCAVAINSMKTTPQCKRDTPLPGMKVCKDLFRLRLNTLRDSFFIATTGLSFFHYKRSLLQPPTAGLKSVGRQSEGLKSDGLQPDGLQPTGVQ